VEGDDWRATLSAEKVPINETSPMRLTEVSVTFTADDGATLEDTVDRFERKAMRAGG